MTTTEQNSYLQDAINAIRTEQQALEILINELDERFITACQLLENCQGRVVVTGMGQVRAYRSQNWRRLLHQQVRLRFFMHPAEAGHGDLGMLVKGDVLIAISNSGQSDEIRRLLPVVEKLNIPMISISRDKRGFLPQSATVALTLGASDEACPLGLAPTSSTTATLALGDALAVALVHSKNFTSDDFALSHPAGALGKRLLTKVSDVMHSTDLPIIAQTANVEQALFSMTSGRLGMTVIVNGDKQVVGVFTDGDLRRALAKNITLSTTIDSVMTENPKTIAQDVRASDALTIMNEKKVNQLLVLDDKKQLVGIISLHDLLQAGVK